MLKTRVITALVLIAFLLPSLFFLPPLAWAILVAAFIGVAGWEWGALLGWNNRRRSLLGAALAAACAVVALLWPATMGAGGVVEGFAPAWILATYGLAAFFWIVVVPAWFSQRWKLPGGLPGILVGLLVLFPAWLAMVQLRVAAPGALLAIMAVVWMADVAAYFSGKAFGRHKLAPSISPGKTVEGACGAAIGVVIYGLVLRFAFAFEPVGLPLWILALLAVTVVSIVGDLFESLLKRQAGLKDSSAILPGHGGVLDRIDSLTSTLPVVALAWLLLGARS
jgi:phosphatidate cytidylyltransferase